MNKESEKKEEMKKLSLGDTARLVVLVHRKFGYDFEESAKAWNRLTDNLKHIAVSEWVKLCNAAMEFNLEECYSTGLSMKDSEAILSEHS